ncbi:MAG: hypothetical protein ACRCVT_13270 [Leadbetterella sp.]
MNKKEHLNQAFSPPQGYFDDMEDQLLSKINLEKNLGKKEILSVSEGYFDKLEDSILEKTTLKSNTKPPRFNLSRNVWKYAASILVILGTTGYFFINHGGSKIDDLSSQEISQYLQDEGYTNTLIEETNLELELENGTLSQELSLITMDEL